jgi:hypothetical protein
VVAFRVVSPLFLQWAVLNSIHGSEYVLGAVVQFFQCLDKDLLEVACLSDGHRGASLGQPHTVDICRSITLAGNHLVGSDIMTLESYIDYYNTIVFRKRQMRAYMTCPRHKGHGQSIGSIPSSEFLNWMEPTYE